MRTRWGYEGGKVSQDSGVLCSVAFQSPASSREIGNPIKNRAAPAGTEFRQIAVAIAATASTRAKSRSFLPKPAVDSVTN